MNDSRRLNNIQKRLLLLLITLTLVRGLIYASVTIPWWAGHDEDFHFAHVRMWIERWSANGSIEASDWPQEMVAGFEAFPQHLWSKFSENQISFPLERYTRVRRFSFSYMLYALPGRLLLSQNILLQLYALRVVSVLMTCATILFAYLSACQVFDDSLAMQILVPWIIIFAPSFMVTGSTVGDASLAILLSSVIFYLLLLEIRHFSGWRLAVAWGLTLLALWTKATTYFLVIVWIILILVAFVWKVNRKYRLWVGLAGGVFVISSLLFLPSRLKKLLASNVSVLGKVAVSNVFSSVFILNTFASFWTIVGWSVYRLASIWYILLLVLLLLAVAGLFVYGWRGLKKSGFSLRTDGNGLLLALLFVGAAIVVVLGHSARLAPGRHFGRYLFPAYVPLSLLMVAGWRALLPPRWQSIGALLIASFFLLFDTVVLLDYAIPWYYPFWPF